MIHTQSCLVISVAPFEEYFALGRTELYEQRVLIFDALARYDETDCHEQCSQQARVHVENRQCLAVVDNQYRVGYQQQHHHNVSDDLRPVEFDLVLVKCYYLQSEPIDQAQTNSCHYTAQ